jgi:peptide/nickel transport system permease protein/dipeptide transport system permease protein
VVSSLGLIFLICFFIAFIPLVADFNPDKQNTHDLLLSPSFSFKAGFFLGTDDLGRDLFARLIYGARTSFMLGISIVLVSLLIGVFLGLLAAVYKGFIEILVLRLADFIMMLPSILLAIIVVATLGTGMAITIIAVALVTIPKFIRVTHAVASNQVNEQYVFAAIVNGTSKIKILFFEILPNCWAPIIVQMTLSFSEVILEIAALGFLGLGVQAPTAEWGSMLSDARPFIESKPLLVFLPGFCILVTVLAINFVGDLLQGSMSDKKGLLNAS